MERNEFVRNLAAAKLRGRLKQGMVCYQRLAPPAVLQRLSHWYLPAHSVSLLKHHTVTGGEQALLQRVKGTIPAPKAIELTRPRMKTSKRSVVEFHELGVPAADFPFCSRAPSSNLFLCRRTFPLHQSLAWERVHVFDAHSR